jgi:Ca-activated chloride channel family protein
MFEFEWPWVFIILPLPLLCYRLLAPRPTRQLAALRVANVTHFPDRSAGQASKSKLSLLLAVSIWLLLVVASAQPRWVGDPMPSPTQARELMLAVDLSASMSETDMELNGRWVDRLTMVKAVLAKFIDQRKGDRIGLILFADNAYIQAPLTFDLSTVKQLLDEAVLGLVGKRTAIGEAIGLAVKRFDRRDQTNRVLVLLTDGENTAGNISPEQALELAIAKNVTIYTIGVGSNRNRVGFFNQGSGVDEQALSTIAKATNGQYFRATDSKELQNIYQHLDQLEKIEVTEQTFRPQKSLYFWPLALALFLSFAAAAMPLVRVK